MCKLFVEADETLWSTRTRSLRLHRAATSIRLEDFFWTVLDEIAERDGMSLNQLLGTLHEEFEEAHGPVDNFASFLRVCCGRYLALQLAGSVPRDRRVSLRSLDAERILRDEAARRGQGAGQAAQPLPLRLAARS